MLDRNRNFTWNICPNDEKANRWSMLYATVNKDGNIVISRFTHQQLGSPVRFLLMYDKRAQIIGLRAPLQADKNTFAASPRGEYGGRRIRGYRLFREFGISISETLTFPNSYIDRNGILILDLTDTRPIRKKDRYGM